MRTRLLGRGGPEVSVVGLGTNNFGGRIDYEQSLAVIDAALDAGVTLIDTADIYSQGTSEEFIGRALEGRRDRFYIATKFGKPMDERQEERRGNPDYIRWAVEGSLRRLRTDVIDVYQMHEPDPVTPIEETLGALNDLVRAGKVRYIGASNIEAWRTARARGTSAIRGWSQFDWVQTSYSLLDRAAEREMLPFCRHEGVGFTAFSPLAGGWLTGKYRRGSPYPEGSRMTLRPEPYLHLPGERVFDGLAKLEDAARARGTTMSALALAWVLHHPQVTAAIVGPRSIAHLDQALGALDVAISPEEAACLAVPFASSRAQPSAST